jgi:hypothetical protein
MTFRAPLRRFGERWQSDSLSTDKVLTIACDTRPHPFTDSTFPRSECRHHPMDAGSDGGDSD